MGPGCRIATHLRLYLRPWEPQGPGGFMLYDGKEAKIEKTGRNMNDPHISYTNGCTIWCRSNFLGKKWPAKPAAHVWWGCCRPPLKEIPEGAYDLVFYLRGLPPLLLWFLYFFANLPHFCGFCECEFKKTCISKDWYCEACRVNPHRPSDESFSNNGCAWFYSWLSKWFLRGMRCIVPCAVSDMIQQLGLEHEA